MPAIREKLIDIDAVAYRLRITRQALDLNQREVCRRARIAENAYSQFETGRRLLTLVPAIKLCDQFGLTLDWLYRDDPSGLPTRLIVKLPPPPRTGMAG